MRMGKIYAKAVKNGSRSLASIGDTWRDATVAALREMVEDGTITEERFAELTEE